MPNADLGHRSDVGAGQQVRDRLRRPRARLADAEDHAARDRVAVGRDHAIGRGVRAVLQMRLQADGHLGPAPTRMDDLVVVDPPALGVEDAHGTEVALDRLAEAEDDRLRLRLQHRTARGRGSLQLGVGLRGRRGDGEAGEGRQRRADDASLTRPPLPPPARPPGPRRRRAPAAHDDHRGRAEDDERQERRDRAHRSAAAGLGDPVQRAGDVALRGADLHRHLPGEDLRALGLVLDLRRQPLTHPVDAMVMPLEAPRAIDELPLRRGVRRRPTRAP